MVLPAKTILDVGLRKLPFLPFSDLQTIFLFFCKKIVCKSLVPFIGVLCVQYGEQYLSWRSK